MFKKFSKRITFSLSALFALGHQGGIFIAFKQSRNLSIGQQGVHALQEAGIQHIRFVQNKSDFLVLAPRSPQNRAQILIKVLSGVLVVYLNA